MRILLTRLDTSNAYQPFRFAVECLRQHRTGAIGLVVGGRDPRYAVGDALHSGLANLPKSVAAQMQSGEAGTVSDGDTQIFVAPLSLPARVLVLGAAPTHNPLLKLPTPRMAYHGRRSSARLCACKSLPARTPRDPCFARRIVATSCTRRLRRRRRHESPSPDRPRLPGHVGKEPGSLRRTTGPHARRQRLLSELGDASAQLANRLAGPVGLDIGAQSAEAIALAIVAEMHAHMHGRNGASFSGLLGALQKEQ